jgi:hypothetical protein
MVCRMVACKVYPSLRENINTPTVWIQGSDLDKRGVVQLCCNKRKVYVDVQIIDDSFIKNYNHPQRKSLVKNEKAIVANQWYREKLGINKWDSIELEIRKTRCSRCADILAALNHPDVAARISAYVANVSLFLGIVSLILALIGFFGGHFSQTIGK